MLVSVLYFTREIFICFGFIYLHFLYNFPSRRAVLIRERNARLITILATGSNNDVREDYTTKIRKLSSLSSSAPGLSEKYMRCSYYYCYVGREVNIMLAKRIQNPCSCFDFLVKLEEFKYCLLWGYNFLFLYFLFELLCLLLFM